MAYEETQGFSPRFRSFAHELAQRWIDRYDVRGKQIVEIGCGKGEFLVAICERGDNRGLGIDPAFVEERLTTSAADRLTFVNALYDGSWGRLDADAVVCRHTIEHIAPVSEFMSSIRAGIGEREDVVVLFDLPDVVRVLREAAFWDIYYEHCSYFSPGSLARLFRRSGFDVLATRARLRRSVHRARGAAGGGGTARDLILWRRASSRSGSSSRRSRTRSHARPLAGAPSSRRRARTAARPSCGAPDRRRSRS